MANVLVLGTDVRADFTTGQGSGPITYFDYAPDLDSNFTAMVGTINQLVLEVRGIQGPNQTLPLDMLLLDDPGGVGVTPDVVVGTSSYATTVADASNVDVAAGVAVVASARVSGNAVSSLQPQGAATLQDTLYWNFVYLDSNGVPNLSSAPGAGVLDLFRVQMTTSGGSAFVTPGNVQKIGAWQYALDGDAWVELSDATGLGHADTFSLTLFDEPKHRLNRIERVLSGYVTDLQDTPETIGPIIIPGGAEGTPGLVFGDGTGTNDLDTGFYRIAADTIGVSTGGNLAVRVDPVGQLDLPLQGRCVAERTASVTISDNSVTELTLTNEVLDVGGWFAASSTDLVCPSGFDGTYLVVGQVEWAAVATNPRDLTIEVTRDPTGGGSPARIEGAYATRLEVPVGEAWGAVVSGLVVLAATDVVSLRVLQVDNTGTETLDVENATLTLIKVA